MCKTLFDEDELKEEICSVMKRLFDRGLISALGGNVSARLPRSKEFWITPSGTFKGGLSSDDLIKMDLEGNVIEGFTRPSTEWSLHAIIYKNREDVNAVIHAHNPFATGLALAGVGIKPVTVGVVLTLGKVPIVPFEFPGTDKLAKRVAEYLPGVRALILQNHGVVGLGYNLLEAETIVETLEEMAITQFVAMALSQGGEIPLIPEKDVELMIKHYKVRERSA